MMLEALRRYWVEEMALTSHQTYLMDTKPIPMVGYKRSKHCSDFAGSATYGYCASLDLKIKGSMPNESASKGFSMRFRIRGVTSNACFARLSSISLLMSFDQSFAQTYLASRFWYRCLVFFLLLLSPSYFTLGVRYYRLVAYKPHLCANC